MSDNIYKKHNVFEKNLHNVFYENSLISNNFKKSINKLSCINSTYPRLFKFNLPSSTRAIRPEFEQLKSKYLDLEKKLNLSNPETFKTSAEIRFKKSLKMHSKKQFLSSVWIGSHCIDLFIPNIRSHQNFPKKVMRGLAIEIDGDSHKREQKCIKDERKGYELLSIGIGTMHVPNWEFNETTIKSVLASISTLPTLDTRDRTRLLTRIYLYTLAIHLPDREFFQIFKLKPITIGGTDGK